MVSNEWVELEKQGHISGRINRYFRVNIVVAVLIVEVFVRDTHLVMILTLPTVI